MKKVSFVLLAIVLGLFSCKDDTPEQPVFNDSTQKSFFTHLADDIIIPAFSDARSSAEALESAVESFQNDVTFDNLTSLKSAFQTAYTDYQAVIPYEFGPSEEVFGLRPYNLFPIQEDKIEDNITNGVDDLRGASYNASRGFPALDYLLYNGSDAEVLAYFQNSSLAVAHLTVIVEPYVTAVTAASIAWPGYRERFISNTGVSATSSLSLLVNAFNIDYENIKNAKFGIPAGRQSSLGTKYPDFVEAVYSGISKDLALANLNAIESIYTGTSSTGVQGVGLEDLVRETGATIDGSALEVVTIQKFDDAVVAVEALSDPLQNSVTAESENFETAAELLQGVVRYFKTEMSNALSVEISYNSNDGD